MVVRKWVDRKQCDRQRVDMKWVDRKQVDSHWVDRKQVDRKQVDIRGYTESGWTLDNRHSGKKKKADRQKADTLS